MPSRFLGAPGRNTLPMNMKLYMTPGSCSTAIHIILEELEEIFEAHIVNLPAGDQFKPDYLAINPKANIPALARPDGTVLTEVPAIAFWLGKARGRGRLWPKDIEHETRALELMTFVAGSIHGHGFARFFAPGNFCPDSSLHQSVKAQGRALVEKTFSIVDKALEGWTWVAGDFSVADAVLFYVEFWGDKVEIALPANLLRHYRAMLDRPAVSRVLREEGYRPEKLGQRVEM
jgi:glutathione S-transferase